MEYVTQKYDIDDLLSVEIPIIRSYIVDLKDAGMENRSINRKISTLRSFYSFYLREKEIKVTPMTGIKSLKQPKELAKFVPEHDIDNISFDDNDDFEGYTIPENDSIIINNLVDESNKTNNDEENYRTIKTDPGKGRS